MKTQKRHNQKKLFLSKETLVRLNQIQMAKIVGGNTGPIKTAIPNTSDCTKTP